MHAEHANEPVRFVGHWHLIVAQTITSPDRSFISLLSACFACIVFLHLR
jgi:hypothetical protein